MLAQISTGLAPASTSASAMSVAISPSSSTTSARPSGPGRRRRTEEAGQPAVGGDRPGGEPGAVEPLVALDGEIGEGAVDDGGDAGPDLEPRLDRLHQVADKLYDKWSASL